MYIKFHFKAVPSPSMSVINQPAWLKAGTGDVSLNKGVISSQHFSHPPMGTKWSRGPVVTHLERKPRGLGEDSLLVSNLFPQVMSKSLSWLSCSLIKLVAGTHSFQPPDSTHISRLFVLP